MQGCFLWNIQFVLQVVILTSLFAFKTGYAISCFVCSSVNGSQPACEDTFNNTQALKFWQKDCMAARKGRTGIFPGTECVKVKAQLADGSNLISRLCVVDSGGINSDTEIGRVTHCGVVLLSYIKMNGEHIRGCLLTCNTDGCNSASLLYHFSWILVVLHVFIILCIQYLF